MPRKIRPLADRIVVSKEVEGERRSEGGLFIPRTSENEAGAIVAEVIDVGEGIYDERRVFIRPLFVEKGQKVLIGKYSGVDFVINNAQYLLVQEIDVLGVVEDSET